MSNNEPKSTPNRLKDFLLSLMVVCFIILAGTGIIKHRELLKMFGVTNNLLPMKEISILHDWAGVALIILIVLHLIVQRGWFVYMYQKSVKYLRYLILILVGILITIGFILLTSSLRRNSDADNLKTLESVEVREYQGENLSSLINDFRENSIKGPQHIAIENYQLEIDGLVTDVQSYSYDQVLAHDQYTKVVTLYCVEGWTAKILWEGVLLKDLFKDAQVDDTANTVIFYAYDGYSSSLPLDYILENDILLAYKVNDVVLPAERGFPFQVVAEDKWGYKWVKWVTRIELSDDKEFRGYWEQRGYNQDGSIDGPKFAE